MVSPTQVPHGQHTGSTDEGEFAALAFKIMTDPFVGQLTFVRVYRGILESGSYAYNTTKDKKERIGRLLKMQIQLL